MLWRQQPPSTSHVGTSLYPAASPSLQSHLPFQVTPPQTTDPGSRSSAFPSQMLLSPESCVSPLSLSLQPQLPFPSHLPSLFFPSPRSYAQARRLSTLTTAIYTQVHLTFPLPWLHSIQHRPAVSFLRQEARWAGLCLLPTPSSPSTPGTGPLGM